MQLPDHARKVMEEHAAAIEFPTLRQAATLLSSAYREGREFPLNSAERIAAYLATRFPATYAAAHAVLEEVRTRLPALPIESVLDVGAGSGAAALAARHWFAPDRITLIERHHAMAGVARELLPEAVIRCQDFTLAQIFPPHDLVIASYALGEPAESRMTDRLWEATRVMLVIVEPGTTRGFSFIREVRSRLLAAGAHMLAPCPHENACPLVAPDWCHFGARVERSSWHRRLKGGTLNYEDEKFSYIALAREVWPTAAARIIRRPRHQAGLIEIEVCTPGGVQTVRAVKRERETFRAARRTAWGDEWKQPL